MTRMGGDFEVAVGAGTLRSTGAIGFRTAGPMPG